MAVKDVITRSDIRFIAFIVAIILTAALYATKQEQNYLLLEQKVSALEHDYESDVSEIKLDLKQIKGNQIKIMVELGIQP